MFASPLSVVLQPVLGHGFPDLFPLTYSLFCCCLSVSCLFCHKMLFLFGGFCWGFETIEFIYEMKSASRPTHSLEGQGISLCPASHSKPVLHLLVVNTTSVSTAKYGSTEVILFSQSSRY
jgi:hypothetical protein